MRWRERYVGLPFSREHVEEIGALLGLKKHDQACFAARSLTVALVLYEISYNAKKRMGPIDKISSKLEQIAAATSALSKLLEDDEILEIPLAGIWEALGSNPALKGLDRGPIWGNRAFTLRDIRNIVSSISVGASKLVENDDLLRSYYFLPPVNMANNNLESSVVWPVIFMIWEQHGNRVGGSVNGSNKLHRLVNLFHEATGLGMPSPNTLNRAIQRWKQDSRRDRPENAAWYYGSWVEDTDAIGEV